MPVSGHSQRLVAWRATGVLAVLVSVLSIGAVISADGRGADGVAALGAAAGCRPTESRRVPQPTPARMAAAGLGRLPVAPRHRRVDLVAPAFSQPTRVTNPLFPISLLASVVLNGHVDGKPFRTETTLLPNTRIVEWSPGHCVRTLVSQYTAYFGGRIEEVALDHYAQGDDGSVWYFGEDVLNYRAGTVLSTDGTWLAGKEGPAAMIMPSRARVGDVNRAENIPGSYGGGLDHDHGRDRGRATGTGRRSHSRPGAPRRRNMVGQGVRSGVRRVLLGRSRRRRGSRPRSPDRQPRRRPSALARHDRA